MKDINKRFYSKTYTCPKCEEPFLKLMDLVKHFNVDHDQTNKCPLCPGKAFVRMGHVNEHVR